MTSITVAELGEIEIGSIKLAVYILPNSEEYFWSMSQISEAAGFNEAWLRGVNNTAASVSNRGRETLKALQDNGFTCVSPEIRIPIVNNGHKKIKAITTDNALAVFKYAAKAGNLKAIDIVVACLGETLERRADVVFNRKRTEEEYQEQTKARMLGKITRRTYTNAIKAYLERHPEKSNSYCDYIYINVSDRINTLVFGMTAKQLRQHRGTTATLLRDTHSAAELQLLERIEDYAMRLIDKADVEPIAAISEAYEFYS